MRMGVSKKKGLLKLEDLKKLRGIRRAVQSKV